MKTISVTMKTAVKYIAILTAFTTFSEKVIGQDRVNTLVPQYEQPLQTTNKLATGGKISWLRRKYPDTVRWASLYGGGALFGLATKAEGVEKTTNIGGSLGLNFGTNRLICNLYYSYNGKDTVGMATLSQFGATLMNPGISGQAGSFSVAYNLFPTIGIKGKVVVVNQQWELSKNASTETEVVESTPLMFKAGFYVHPFDFSLVKNNTVKVLISLNYTHRSILGNFSHETRVIEGKEIAARGYNGFELSTSMIFNDIEIFGQYSINGRGKGQDFDIPGFNKQQITFGVNVTGEFVTLL